MKMMLLTIGFAITSLSGGASQAATVSIDTFSTSGYQSATGLATAGTTESFEGYQAGAWGAATISNVGTFASVGGTGSGKTCRDLAGGPQCQGLRLQDRDTQGQGNIVPAEGTRSLSSGDTFGIVWDVFTRTGALFDSVVFGLRDVADISGTVFSITVDGVTRTLTAEEDGNQKLVTIDFGRSIRSATIQLLNMDAQGASRLNDSFTLDGASINLAPSPVPLPAGVFLLGAALAGLGAMRARKKAA